MGRTRNMIILVIALVMGAGGCYYDKEQDLYPDSFCDLTSVTWSGDIQPLVASRCAVAACHVPAATSPDLTTYAGVKTIADNGLLHQVVIVDKSMPQNGPLSSCQIQMFNIWLSDGAPQN